MLQNLNKTWSNNHGWLLSGASLIVGCVACVIWYLDLVPRMIFSGTSPKSSAISQTIQPQSGILVAQINASPENKGDIGRILLYPKNSDQNQLPLYQEKFTFDERGMAAILLIVPNDEYVVIAFIDENDNGQLDFDGEQALESFCLPRAAKSGPESNEDQPPTEGGLIALQAQVPILCIFDFVNQ